MGLFARFFGGVGGLFGENVHVATVSETEALEAAIEEFGVSAVDTALDAGWDPDVVAQIAAEAGLDL